MTKTDGYKHRHKWVEVSTLYGVKVMVCEKCERKEG
ncbi:hypothetical protein LCGC14_1201730 [marine sediment metagenome]|uniref:Uncharacterized protein n=1 Tax=marine sediment metagenome TaxID=412755 RepID=A0A0F9PLF4_9ZZZZ